MKLIIGPSGHEDDTKTTGLTSEVAAHGVVLPCFGHFFCALSFNSVISREGDQSS